MDEITRRFPGLSSEHLREVTRMVVHARNAVAASNLAFPRATWGLACLACQVVKLELEDLHRAGTHAWMRYVGEPGMAYTVVIDSIPLRVQPEVDEVRDVMPGEEAAMAKAMEIQLALLPEAEAGILRLEVAQRACAPVDRVTLFLFERHTGAKVDSFVVYERGVGKSATLQGPNKVVALQRPAQDIDPTTRYAFDDKSDAENDDDRDE